MAPLRVYVSAKLAAPAARKALVPSFPTVRTVLTRLRTLLSFNPSCNAKLQGDTDSATVALNRKVSLRVVRTRKVSKTVFEVF